MSAPPDNSSRGSGERLTAMGLRPTKKIKEFSEKLDGRKVKESLRLLVSENFWQPIGWHLCRIWFFIQLGTKKDFELKNHAPVTTERSLGNEGTPTKIYQLWLQGWENAPALVKACAASLDKYKPRSHEVIRLDRKNLMDHTSIPRWVLRRLDRGLITKAYFSDLLRANLLGTVGGVWIDATVLLTSEPKEFKNSKFVFRSTPYNLGGKNRVSASSWFIVSKNPDPIFWWTYVLLKNQIRVFFLPFLYLQFHAFFTLLNGRLNFLDEKGSEIISTNVPPHFLQQRLQEEFNNKMWADICSSTDIHKLSHYGSGPIDAKLQSKSFFDSIVHALEPKSD